MSRHAHRYAGSDTIALTRRVWRCYLRDKTRIIVAIFVWIAVIAGATAAYPLIINFAFDAFAARDQRALLLVPAAVLVAALTKAGSMYIQAALSNRLNTDIERDLRTDIYRSLIDADIAQISRKSTAGQTARFVTDIGYVLAAIDRFVKTAARDLMTIAALLGTMFWLNWQLTLVTLVTSPLAIWPMVEIGRRLRVLSTRTQEQIGDMTAGVHESLAAARIVKTYNLEGWLKERIGALFESVRELRRRALNLKAGVQPTMEAIGGVSATIIFAFAGWRIVSGQNTVGEFTGFMAAVILAAQPLNALGSLNAVLQEGLAAVGRIFAVLDERPQIRDRPDAVALAPGPGRIEFCDVDFSYDGSTPAVSGINLVIKAKSRVALVGRSGAGKSTLVSLIPRFYDPDAGTVTIDGQDTAALTLQSLRDMISFVSQDVILFDDTIRTNIAVGRLGAGDDAIVAAAKAAAAHDFITAMADGYETRVGDRGLRLSGGERQRVAMARAILKDAPILLLDEATSALDPESEALIQDALAALSRERTTLVIAHRLSTVRDADMIVVMDGGRIVASGTHRKLIAESSLYARLYRHQFRGDDAGLFAAQDDIAEEAAPQVLPE